MPKNNILSFVRALDKNDFHEARMFLSDDCVYVVGEKTIKGADAIISSYQGNWEWGRKNIDEIYFESHVAEASGRYLVTYTDHLRHKGKTHVYQCQQLLTDQEGIIVRIEHREIPGERQKLEEFEQEVGIVRPGKVRRVFSKAPWEKPVGYCRAIRSGNHIFVTGTAPVDSDGNVVAPGQPYLQAKRCLEIIQSSLTKLGADISDVVRTRMFVTDISKWQEFGRAHGEVFGDHPPATTMVEVKALIDPQMMIEIEADAMVKD